MLWHLCKTHHQPALDFRFSIFNFSFVNLLVYVWQRPSLSYLRLPILFLIPRETKWVRYGAKLGIARSPRTMKMLPRAMLWLRCAVAPLPVGWLA